MKDRALNISEVIRKLRKQGRDDANYEAKKCEKDLSNDVWESVSAFANTDGGTLLLGIDEENDFSFVQNFQIDRVCDQFVAGMADGESAGGRLTNVPQYHINRISCDEGIALEICISELDVDQKPCYITKRGIQGGSYKRIDDKDIKLSPNEIFEIQSATEVDNSDRAIVENAVRDDLDANVYEAIFARALTFMPRSMRGASTVEDRLRRLNFVDPNDNVMRAGLLVAGVYPQQFFPKLNVDVAVHPGTKKSAGGTLRFKDRTLCEGTLGEMIEDAIVAVSKNLRRRTTIEGLDRKDDLEIPETVLREAVTNALIHRSYNPRFDGEAVAIDVYDDRIEITSPGGLWGKSRAALMDGRSCCRNATIMKLMSLAPLRNSQGTPAEGNGSGILLMINDMLANGLDQPEFYPRIDHFKVILRRPVLEEYSQTLVKKGEGYIEKLLETKGEMSIRELADETGMTVNQVRRRVNKLLDVGALEPTAPKTSRSRKYKIRK